MSITVRLARHENQNEAVNPLDGPHERDSGQQQGAHSPLFSDRLPRVTDFGRTRLLMSLMLVGDRQETQLPGAREATNISHNGVLVHGYTEYLEHTRA
jgi:hypothetical protein